MDKAIFLFDNILYTRNAVENFNRKICEHLCNADEDNVTKFDLECSSLEEAINDDDIDFEGSWVRVFI